MLSPSPPARSSSIPCGLWPVMLTPFGADGRVDWRAFDQLVDWYIEAGAAGLFAVCLSSEMFHLTPAERLALATRAVGRAAGRVPVVATATFAPGASFPRRMAATGVTALVCLTNHFASESESASVWKTSAQTFLQKVDPAVPLGLYECPRPYKRLLTAAQFRWAAQTGRFTFLKDTSCQIGTIKARIVAARGTDARLFNANTPTLLASLGAGAHGYSGIAANYLPRLYAWLCAHHATHPVEAAELGRFLTVADPLISARYPAAAKIFLGMGGLRLSSRCRQSQPRFAEEDLLMLRSLHQCSANWHRRLNLANPLPKTP